MIISADSPLRRLPSNLDRKQTLFLDAMRYSIEMASLSYSRLCHTLLNISVKHDKKIKIYPLLVSSFQDAWSIIDSIYRLRSLLIQAPRFKQKASGLQLFLRNTATIDDLRNSIQHLNTQIQAILNQNIPALGVLTWFTIMDPNGKEGLSCALISGTMFSSEHIIINPCGKTTGVPIGLVTLTASGYSVCLSDVIDNVRKLTNGIEHALESQKRNLPQAGADLFICVVMEFGDDSNQGATEPSQ